MEVQTRLDDQDTVKRRLAFQKSYSQEHGGSWRRKSLIEDAKFETVTNIEFAKQERKSRGGSISEEEEVFASHDNGEVISPVDKDDTKRQYSILISLRDGMTSLSRVFRVFEATKVALEHIESRPTNKNGAQFDIFLQFNAAKETMTSLLNTLRQNSTVLDMNILYERQVFRNEPWFPKHISELDNCTHLVTKFEPELDCDHPGFTDKAYRGRRKEIADIAFDYRHGITIPRVEYTADEIATWGHVYRNLKDLLPKYACAEHNEVFAVLESECGYSADCIPQLEDVSNFLKNKTGFQLRPVAGLLSARDFLASLAFRVFQCTQYVRHGSKPDHSPEPDCVHELLGHVPMLATPLFAKFSQNLGLATLGASDADIEKFATLYWFTVEFGLCNQNGALRAYGAGVLSSYGELTHALSDAPQRLPFDPLKTAVQEYTDEDLQPLYFVTESFEDMMGKMQDYFASIKRPYEVVYDPFTQSVRVLNNKEELSSLAVSMKENMDKLQISLARMSPSSLH